MVSIAVGRLREHDGRGDEIVRSITGLRSYRQVFRLGATEQVLVDGAVLRDRQAYLREPSSSFVCITLDKVSGSSPVVCACPVVRSCPMVRNAQSGASVVSAVMKSSSLRDV